MSQRIRMTYGAIREAWGALRYITGPGCGLVQPEKAQRLYRVMVEVGRHAEDADRVRSHLQLVAREGPQAAAEAQRRLATLDAMEVELALEPLPEDFFAGAAVAPGALYALGPLYAGWTARESAELPEPLRALVANVAPAVD